MTIPPASPQPQPQPSVNVTVTHPPANNLGLAGFITSILGLISCGVLSPVGLILSLIGLFKQPRGFAIAGTIIGLIGSILLAVVGAGIVLGVLGIGAAAKAVKEYGRTYDTARQVYAQLEQQRKQGGVALDATAASAVAAKYNDGWGTPLRAEVAAGGAITIVSAGRDKSFGTEDDLRLDELDLQATTLPSSTQPAGGGGGGGFDVDD